MLCDYCDAEAVIAGQEQRAGQSYDSRPIVCGNKDNVSKIHLLSCSVLMREGMLNSSLGLIAFSEEGSKDETVMSMRPERCGV